METARTTARTAARTAARTRSGRRVLVSLLLPAAAVLGAQATSPAAGTPAASASRSAAPTPSPTSYQPGTLPVQEPGVALGAVRVSCWGTVRARLRNSSNAEVTYRLRVGGTVHRVAVRAQDSRRFVAHGRTYARVVLSVGGTRLDRVRVPGPCRTPQGLPVRGAPSAAP